MLPGIWIRGWAALLRFRRTLPAPRHFGAASGGFLQLLISALRPLSYFFLLIGTVIRLSVDRPEQSRREFLRRRPLDPSAVLVRRRVHLLVDAELLGQSIPGGSWLELVDAATQEALVVGTLDSRSLLGLSFETFFYLTFALAIGGSKTGF